MGLFKREETENELKVGDRVRVIETNQEGFITGQDGEECLVLLNDSVLIEKYAQDELEKIW